MKFQRQRGMTLIMGLIMLIVLTLLALTSFSLGKSNMVVVSNMQQRDQTIAAAREVIEEVISNTKFTETPDNALVAPCEGKKNVRCVDVNGDGVDDVKVTLAPPVCVKAKKVKLVDLNPTVKADIDCSHSSDNNDFGKEGTEPGASSCSDSTWELTVTAKDVSTEASTDVIQGIGVRVPTNTVAKTCP